MRLLSFFSVFLFCACTTAFGALADGICTIEAIGGAEAVSVKRASSALVLKKGDSLLLGDVIETDSHTVVDIRCSDNSLVRIGTSTNFTMQKKSAEQKRLLQEWFSILLKGTVRVLVPEVKNSDGIRYQLNTPASTMGVRGTEFVAAHLKDKSAVHTLKGTVLFGSNKADFSLAEKFVSVEKGHTSTISTGDSAPTKTTAFPLEEFLKQIDSVNSANAFHALATRKNGAPERSTKPVPATPQAIVKKNTKPETGSQNKDIAQKNSAKGTEIHISPNDRFFEALSKNADTSAMIAAAKAGAIVDFTMDGGGEGPFHIAVLKAQYRILVQTLISLGADINKTNRKGYTALMILAAEKDDPEAVRFLVEQGANPSLAAADGSTALSIAKERGHSDIVKYIESLK